MYRRANIWKNESLLGNSDKTKGDEVGMAVRSHMGLHWYPVVWGRWAEGEYEDRQGINLMSPQVLIKNKYTKHYTGGWK